MFIPLGVTVKSLGEDVELAIGNWKRRIHFEVAVLLAAWLDECARDAKSWSQDKRRILKATGTLHDASNHNWINVGQPNDPRHVATVSRDMLRLASIAVRQVETLVVLKAGDAEAAIPYKAALEISQWIRLKAKESQTRAGDVTRHWSNITKAHTAQHGPGVTRG